MDLTERCSRSSSPSLVHLPFQTSASKLRFSASGRVGLSFDERTNRLAGSQRF